MNCRRSFACRLHGICAVLLYFVSTTHCQQWSDPWMEGPPASSAANGHANITANGNQFIINAEENIESNTTLAVLRYTVGKSEPVLGSCFNTIKLGPAASGSVDIVLVRTLDFESSYPNTESCIVYILDPTPVTRTFSIRVQDLNDNRPFFTNLPPLNTLQFTENQQGLVWDFDARDADAGDTETLKFTLRMIIGSGSNLTLDGSTGQLSVVGLLDYESGQFYLFAIDVTDRAGLSATVQIGLNVEDVKDMPPKWTKQVPFTTIQEELPIDSIVFTVAAQDGDTFNDEIIYSIQDARQSFRIDNRTGDVIVAGRINRDVDQFDPNFDLIITARCLNSPEYQSVTTSSVFVNDINDNLPTFDRQIYEFQVDERFAGVLSQMDIQVSDPDLNDNAAYVMTIEGPPDAVRFLALNAQTGKNDATFSLRITSADLLDYELAEKRAVTVQIVATEKSGTGRKNVANVTITSQDINDNSPVFVQQNYDNVVIRENIEIGSLVVDIDATDADASSAEFGQASIRYSFVENFDAGRYFNIDDVTGVVTTSANIDRESIGSSQLRYTIQAIDKNGAADGRRTVTNITITIEDINDDPPRFDSLTTATYAVSEGAATSTDVATVTATDRDDQPQLTLSINWETSVFFKNRAQLTDVQPEWKKTFVIVETPLIKSSSVKGVVQVGDAVLPPGNCVECGSSPLDREIFDSVRLCLRVSDTATETGSDHDEICIVVDVTDMNDNDPVFDAFDSFVVVENTAVGTFIGTLSATDADQANAISYSISPVDCPDIQINSINGQLKTAREIDRELIDNIECDVTATDSGSPKRSTVNKIKVSVLDINDNAPVLTVSVNPIVIDECYPGLTSDGQLLSELTATDLDTGDYGTVRFLMASSNLEGVDEFDVDSVTGALTVRNCALLNYEAKQDYSFLVEARDNYRPSVITGSTSTFERINVTLRDVNDNPPILPGTVPGSCFASPLESIKKDEVAVAILGNDTDSPGPNNWMTFTLHSQQRIGDQLAKCVNLFAMRTETDNKTGSVYVTVDDLLDCQGNYDIQVQACDQGVAGSLCSANVTYRLCVQDVNNNRPQFVFPSPFENVITVVEVLENSTVGDIVRYNGTNQLILSATDSDELENGRVTYTWKNETVNAIFKLDSSSGIVTLQEQLDRTVASYYTVTVVATDNAVTVTDRKSSESQLRINIRLVNERQPEFNVDIRQELIYTENEMEDYPFQEAIHPDNNNLYLGETPYDFCYYLVCGNRDDFEIKDKTVNQLSNQKPLDREGPPAVLYVIVETSNDCDNPPPSRSCSESDFNDRQHLNISIKIADVNDVTPALSGSLAGGITSGDKKKNTVFHLNVIDPDENDVVTCRIEDDYTTSDESLNSVAKPPFSIDANHNVLLEFDVLPNMKGYFTLNVTCTDLVNHSIRKPIKIYVVTDANKIDILFNNTLADVDSKRANIEEIFTAVLNYTCSVEKVTNYQAVYITALSHFIDPAKNEPVLFEDIIALTAKPAIDSRLYVEFLQIGLNYISTGPIATVSDNSEQVFRILFIIACVAVILMTILVAFLLIRRNELNRRVAVLSGQSGLDLGSKSSGLDHIGTSGMIPTSNRHAVEGSNPIYSIELSSHPHHDDNFDNISQSSGDSILIGVENNPEFRNYNPRKKQPDLIPGFYDNNVIRRNPLVSEGPPEPSFPPPPPPPSSRSTKRPAPPAPSAPLPRTKEEPEEPFESSSDNDYDHQAINSNFTFSKNTALTEL